MASVTPRKPRLLSFSRNSFQLVALSRFASSTPKTCRRPSQSTPKATKTARLRMNALFAHLLIPGVQDQVIDFTQPGRADKRHGGDRQLCAAGADRNRKP